MRLNDFEITSKSPISSARRRVRSRFFHCKCAKEMGKQKVWKGKERNGRNGL